jgi:hypothetical protein
VKAQSKRYRSLLALALCLLLMGPVALGSLCYRARAVGNPILEAVIPAVFWLKRREERARLTDHGTLRRIIGSTLNHFQLFAVCPAGWAGSNPSNVGIVFHERAERRRTGGASGGCYILLCRLSAIFV